MRLRSCWQLSVLLLLAGIAAAAHTPDSNQNLAPASPSAESATPAKAAVEAQTAPATKSEVTVTSEPPRAERPLPALRPEEFTKCMSQLGKNADSPGQRGGDLSAFHFQAGACKEQMDSEKHLVIEACMNRGGDTAPPRIIQACTELMEPDLFERSKWFLLFASRAEAYVALGDKQHALADYDAAINSAPHNAALYYNRGAFYAAQSDDEAALRDFEKAIAIDSKLVPARRQRARIYQARGNSSAALADYSEAIRLQPKDAALWAERGDVVLRQHDYPSAIRDETQAIQLDPKMARAYFLRGAALRGRGDAPDASVDIKTALGLDPSLARYVTIEGNTTSVTLPPF